MSAKPAPAEDRQRIDKWLFHARVIKTRTGAQRLVEQGFVRLNGRRIGLGSQAVKPGDILTIAFENAVRVLKVTGFAPRRVSPPQVHYLYADESPPPIPREERAPPAMAREPGAGRPTKRDRRLIDHLKGRD